MEDKKKVLSIKDIAAISGVSIATVSRILNKKGRYPYGKEGSGCRQLLRLRPQSNREKPARSALPYHRTDCAQYHQCLFFLSGL